MPKIPESYGIIAKQSQKEKLKPQEKINKINEIVDYLHHKIAKHREILI
jgi:hypothetical protein